MGWAGGGHFGPVFSPSSENTASYLGGAGKGGSQVGSSSVPTGREGDGSMSLGHSAKPQPAMGLGRPGEPAGTWNGLRKLLLEPEAEGK